MQQGTDEWFAARLGIPTASRFGDVMATGRGGKPSATRKNYMAQLLLERLTGQRQETFQSAAMRWGTETEPLAREAYEAEEGVLVEECGLITLGDDARRIGASPDGLVGDDGLLEIKCPESAQALQNALDGLYHENYHWQVQGQLLITGRKWCDFVVFDPRLPEKMQYHCTRIMAGPTAIGDLSKGLRDFASELAIFETQLKEKYAITE
jgi:putative phage-type endonuclease